MLTEVKVRVSRVIDSKTRKRTETYLTEADVFAQAEIAVMTLLEQQTEEGLVEDFEIQSLRISPIKEICTQYQGEETFVITLKDIFIDDNGNEKYLRYKVLLWADSLSQANARAGELSHQGYSMLVEGIKQAEYEYLTPQENEN